MPKRQLFISIEGVFQEFLGVKGVLDKSLYNVHFDKNDRPYLTYGIVTTDLMKLYFLWQGWNFID